MYFLHLLVVAIFVVVVVSGPSSVALGVETTEQALTLVSLAHAQQVHAARMLVEHVVDVVRRQLIGGDETRELLGHFRLLLQRARRRHATGVLTLLQKGGRTSKFTHYFEQPERDF